MTLVLRKSAGDLTKFKPEKTRSNQAKLDALIKYANDVKEWQLLEEAVEAKIRNQIEFVEWWKKNVRNEGRHKLTGAEQGQLESATGISHQQVSKWKKRLKDTQRYAETLRQPSYKKMWGVVETKQEDRKWPDMIEGKFALIYADPPWQYEYSLSESREIENQYPTMTVEEIAARYKSLPAADDCMLFLWATSPKLKEAMWLIEQWDFAYKTCAVWDKQKIGMGYYFRQQHELLLVATRGTPPPPQRSLRPSSIISSPRQKHSQKPQIVYEILESLYPAFTAKHRLELFCRERRPSWSAWGNELET